MNDPLPGNIYDFSLCARNFNLTKQRARREDKLRRDFLRVEVSIPRRFEMSMALRTRLAPSIANSKINSLVVALYS